jgi:hypothetical protein
MSHVALLSSDTDSLVVSVAFAQRFNRKSALRDSTFGRVFPLEQRGFLVEHWLALSAKREAGTLWTRRESVMVWLSAAAAV